MNGSRGVATFHALDLDREKDAVGVDVGAKGAEQSVVVQIGRPPRDASFCGGGLELTEVRGARERSEARAKLARTQPACGYHHLPHLCSSALARGKFSPLTYKPPSSLNRVLLLHIRFLHILAPPLLR